MPRNNNTKKNVDFFFQAKRGFVNGYEYFYLQEFKFIFFTQSGKRTRAISQKNKIFWIFFGRKILINDATLHINEFGYSTRSRKSTKAYIWRNLMKIQRIFFSRYIHNTNLEQRLRRIYDSLLRCIKKKNQKYVRCYEYSNCWISHKRIQYRKLNQISGRLGADCESWLQIFLILFTESYFPSHFVGIGKVWGVWVAIPSR